MKSSIILASLCFLLNTAYAGVGRDTWQKADEAGKAEILKIYSEFFMQASQLEVTAEWEQNKTTLFQFVSEAYAADGMDCIYAGWPSVRHGSCSSPLKSNPDYDQGQCAKGDMQCQPLLFGEGVCVPVASKEERSMAFTNCNKKFKEAKKDLAAVVKEIKEKKKEAELLKLLDFADQICKTGTQAKTLMCTRLKSQVTNVRSELEKVVKSIDKIPQVIAETAPQKVDCAPSNVPLVVREERKTRAVPREEVSDAPALVSTGDTVPYVQDRPRENVCSGRVTPRAEDGKEAGFSNITNFPCNGNGERIYAGVSISGADYHDLDFGSQDGSKAGSYIYLTEAVLDRDSYNVKSMMFLLPRKGIPTAKAVGDEILVTLSTGEIVVYDRASKKIKSGALLEGPSDPNPDRFTRKPPNIQYKGSGISIRVDHRYEHPTSAAGDPTAEVKQNGRTCSVPRAKLWDDEGEVLDTDDSKVVTLLNQLCPAKKGEKPFSL